MTDTKIEKSETAQTQVTRIGFDNLLEDLFGMNIRGFKTIWVLVTRPKLYFIAAKTPDWQERYTPSFRVWFAIIALTAALAWVWAGPDSPMFNIYREGLLPMVEGANKSLAPQGLMIEAGSFNVDQAARDVIRWTNIFLPVTYFMTLGVIAFLFRSFGERLPYIVRLRYVFAIIIPGSLLGLLSGLGSIFLDNEVFKIINLGSMGLMFASYFAVAYFGAFSVLPNLARFGRSVGLTALLIVGVLAASVLAVIPSTFVSAINNMPEPVPIETSIGTAVDTKDLN